MKTITLTPFACETARPRRVDPDLLDILATASFWRLRAVEFTLLAAIVFFLGFAMTARL